MTPPINPKFKAEIDMQIENMIPKTQWIFAKKLSSPIINNRWPKIPTEEIIRYENKANLNTVTFLEKLSLKR